MALNHLVSQTARAGVKIAPQVASNKLEAAVNKIKRERHAFAFLGEG
jgi:hypothetical protein